MRRLFVMLSCVTFLAACGGGGGTSTSNNPPAPGTDSGDVTLTGKVAGTDIVAVDNSTGAIVRKTATVSGSDKVFSIKVQSGKNYRFFLVENVGTATERIYPFYIGANNLFTISTAGTFDLGFVGTDNGNATPANTPAQLTGSVSNATIPSGILANNANAFKATDLQGTWNFFKYTAGSDPNWYRATLTIDSQGNVTPSNIQSSTGSTTGSFSPMTIQPSGVLYNPNPQDSTRAVMSSNKSIIVGTGGSTGSERLFVMTKAGSGFIQNDLAGSWKLQTLLGSSNWSDWERQDVTITSNGLLSITNKISGSGDTDSNVSGLSVSISNGGVVSMPSGGPNNFYCTMSIDKNLMVATWTNDGGSVGFGIFVKRGSGFSNSDLVGTWRSNWLATGDTQNIWARSLLTVDVNGYSSSFGIVANGMSEPNSTNSSPITLSSSGILSNPNNKFEGTMSPNKNIMVYTGLKGTNLDMYQLGILIK